MIPDGAGGHRCKEKTPCMVGRAGSRSCPRDAASGLRIDQVTAGVLLAEGPWFTDESIASDLSEAPTPRERGQRPAARIPPLPPREVGH